MTVHSHRNSLAESATQIAIVRTSDAVVREIHPGPINPIPVRIVSRISVRTLNGRRARLQYENVEKRPHRIVIVVGEENDLKNPRDLFFMALKFQLLFLSLMKNNHYVNCTINCVRFCTVMDNTK